EQRAGGLLAAHDGIFRSRPGEDEARVEGFAAQSVVARAIRAAQDERDFRNDAVGDDVDQLGAGANDAGLLRFAAHHEAIHVLEEDKRHAGRIAVHDEASGLIRRIDVDHPTVLELAARKLDSLPLIGDDSDGDTAKPTVTAYQRLPEFRLVLIKWPGI